MASLLFPSYVPYVGGLLVTLMSLIYSLLMNHIFVNDNTTPTAAAAATMTSASLGAAFFSMSLIWPSICTGCVTMITLWFIRNRWTFIMLWRGLPSRHVVHHACMPMPPTLHN
jgi:uncharacterized membrane protein